ncbi:hypothetical protein C7450_106280 [Chelatococcus asaccharovorans]|uniref:Uncharacterized protein n=1 Tax=Chelatococcus asaccharovorans TaxID=28210 RepID=A0A2V3U6H0_9HYPH|nr:hypothetical protein C7450_106280 [Chelatococcus asaccharovorans]
MYEDHVVARTRPGIRGIDLVIPVGLQAILQAVRE